MSIYIIFVYLSGIAILSVKKLMEILFYKMQLNVPFKLYQNLDNNNISYFQIQVITQFLSISI